MDVIWTDPALNDLDEIQEGIAQDSPAAAYKLVSLLIDRTNKLLSQHPLAGRTGRVRATREFVVRDTPYIVVYRVNDRVEIIAVVHGARQWPNQLS